jgi:hypothetical protein
MTININKMRLLLRITVVCLLIFIIQCQATTVQAAQNSKTDSGASKVYMRGLYIPNHHSRNLKFVKSLISKGKPYGINMLVFDVHSYGSTILKVNSSVIEYLKSEKIYVAGRVVCFQDGITKLPIPAGQMKILTDLVSSAADSGFDEIQLDYIRFADAKMPYSLKRRYEVIEDMLKNFRNITDERKIKLSADVFGRVVYNKDDLIGQKLELFAAYTDVIYPMLYPSHFNLDKKKMSEPGETVKDGVNSGVSRLEGKKVFIQPYIQAFDYNIYHAKVKLDKYVALQIKGVEETGARGWVAWNPNGDYSSVFSGINIINIEMVAKTE